MDLNFVAPDLRKLDETSAEILACPIWREERPMRGLAGLLDWRLAGRLSRLQREDYLKGELGEVLCIPGRPRLPFDKVLIFGLGSRTTFGEATFRQVVTHLLHTLEGLRVRRAVVQLPGRVDGQVSAEDAAAILVECIGDSPAHDAWWLVEDADSGKRMMKRAVDEQRRARRS
jgi:hypothetical protein